MNSLLPILSKEASDIYKASSFPVKCLPPLFHDAVVATCISKEAPAEMAASIFIAAASLACLSLVEVIPTHTDIPEPASLYMMVIADSGMGKSTVLESVARVFYDTSSDINKEYQKLVKEFNIAQAS